MGRIFNPSEMAIRHVNTMLGDPRNKTSNGSYTVRHFLHDVLPKDLKKARDVQNAPTIAKELYTLLQEIGRGEAIDAEVAEKKLRKGLALLNGYNKGLTGSELDIAKECDEPLSIALDDKRKGWKITGADGESRELGFEKRQKFKLKGRSDAVYKQPTEAEVKKAIATNEAALFLDDLAGQLQITLLNKRSIA